MNDTRARELWSRLLSGRDLTRDEESELVETLRADEALREAFLRDARMDGVLRQFARTDPEGQPEKFRIRFLHSLAAQRDGAEFVRRVRLRTGAGQGPSTRGELRREGRNRARPYWGIGLAAGALIGVLAVWIARDSRGPDSASGGGVPARPTAARPALPEPSPAAPERPDRERPPAPTPERRDPPEALPAKSAPPDPKGRREIVEDPRPSPDRPEKVPGKSVPPDPPPAEGPRTTLPAPNPTRPTAVAAIAKVMESRAEIFSGQGLTAKEDLRIVFHDGTMLELEGGTQIKEFSETPGKRVVIGGGSVLADVTKQAHPMVFATSLGEVTILGTRIRLDVDSKATRVEVSEGRVGVKRLKDKAAVEISSGYFAVLAEGAAPKPQKTVRRTLSRFDFEDGTLPAGWSNGRVERGPARPGNRFCLAVAEKADGGAREAVFGGKGPPLITVEPGVQLTFDYWVAGASRVWVYLWDETQERAFRMALPRGKPRQWSEARVSLEEFRGEEDVSFKLKRGDGIRSMGFGGEFEGDGALYIDNVEISQSR